MSEENIPEPTVPDEEREHYDDGESDTNEEAELETE